jgi:hypothetical protein
LAELKKIDGVYANATLPGLVIKPEPADKRAGEAKQHRNDSVHPDAFQSKPNLIFMVLALSTTIRCMQNGAIHSKRLRA